jgi:hypothetical protein
MSIVLLRTLTPKSIIGFGAFTDLTVQNLLDTFRYKELLEIYYNFRNIDYCQELKETLCIVGDRVIDKKEPNPDRFFKDAKNKIFGCMSDIIEKKTPEQKKSELNFRGKNKRDSKKRVSASQYRMQATLFGKAANKQRNQW